MRQQSQQKTFSEVRLRTGDLIGGELLTLRILEVGRGRPNASREWADITIKTQVVSLVEVDHKGKAPSRDSAIYLQISRALSVGLELEFFGAKRSTGPHFARYIARVANGAELCIAICDGAKPELQFGMGFQTPGHSGIRDVLSCIS